MALAKQLAYDFSAGLRTRGLAYYQLGRVMISAGSATGVKATVRGSGVYKVSLSCEDGALYSSCDCPYSNSTGPCKHLWATILAADAKGYLSAAASYRRLEAVYGWNVGDDSASPAEIFELPRNGLPGGSPLPRWKREIAEIDRRNTESPGFEEWPRRRQILYVVDVQGSSASGNLVLELFMRDRKQSGEGFNKLKELRISRSQISDLPEPVDSEILSLLSGGRQYSSWSYLDASEDLASRYRLMPPLSDRIMPMVGQTGRCHLKLPNDRNNLIPLKWDEGAPWQFTLALKRLSGTWRVAGTLKRDDREMDISEPVLVTRGLVFTHESMARLSGAASLEWISRLRHKTPIEAPDDDSAEMLAALLEHPTAPPLRVPEELEYREHSVEPKPRLHIRAAPRGYPEHLQAELLFDYEGRSIAAVSASRGFYDATARQFIPRDTQAEAAAHGLLLELGVKLVPPSYYEPEPAWQVPPKKLPSLVRALTEAGWRVDADGKTFRRSGAQRLEVVSGVDWFELRGEIDFGAASAKIPDVLLALRRGEEMVRLDDGSYGMLPQEWLSRLGPLSGLSAAGEDHIRFRRSQAGLLDALLATQPEVSFDEGFKRLREQLRDFRNVQAEDQPAGFTGVLRDYQREGLGWMSFLRRFGFGGCLADDMGLGKTAQVLALLENRRELQRNGGKASGEKPVGPSLVVVPKSLVFNWKQEAERFTPKLRVLDHTGLSRNTSLFAENDVVLTTYGTLRRDAVLFQNIEFDYVVLDEAQAIKNAGTESAKAARLLRGRHRLALSGTPVENHLGELWSLFEFLNPGMLGSASLFGLSDGASRTPDEETRRVLAQTLRPFILRRTKEQVARELPPKTEQTIYCEMEAPQRKLYNELRAHYRNSLLNRIDQHGLMKSKMHVLEALLRLRQAACHPGLLDVNRTEEPSAKLEVLIGQLTDVLAEGHKALVFSQFTSLLRIVRDRLDALGFVYEYLDGSTRDRQARVERFQNDPDCPLFLISLKAGGLGLNLTAAEYVFLLDPWWNPATEAQAVDRAHRIGQSRHVFAYRLIARDTVEEKVLELQNSKRDLAAAIITEANSLIRDLRREDLELLLS